MGCDLELTKLNICIWCSDSDPLPSFESIYWCLARITPLDITLLCLHCASWKLRSNAGPSKSRGDTSIKKSRTKTMKMGFCKVMGQILQNDPPLGKMLRSKDCSFEGDVGMIFLFRNWYSKDMVSFMSNQIRGNSRNKSSTLRIARLP